MKYTINRSSVYNNIHSTIFATFENGIRVELSIPPEVPYNADAVLQKLKGMVESYKQAFYPDKVYLPAPNPEGDDYHATPTFSEEKKERYFLFSNPCNEIHKEDLLTELLNDPDDHISSLTYASIARLQKEGIKILKPFEFPCYNKEGNEINCDSLEKAASQTEYNIPGWETKCVSDMGVIREGEINSPAIEKLDFFDMLLNPSPKKEKEAYIVSEDAVVWPNKNTKMMYMVPDGFIDKNGIVPTVEYWDPLNIGRNRFPVDDEQPENWYNYGELNPISGQFYVKADEKRFFLKMYDSKPIKEGGVDD